MENKKLIISLLLSLMLAASLCACKTEVNLDAGSGHRILKKEDAKKFNLEKASVQAIKKIEITTRIADIEIMQADDYYVEINYLYWDEEPAYKLENGKLTFNDEKSIPKSYSINFDPQNAIKVYLPENAPVDRISLHNSSGNVTLSGFLADNLKTSLSYGDLTMSDCAAVTAVIELSSGQSIISNFHVGELNYSNSYGDLSLSSVNIGESRLPEGVSFDKIDIRMSGGDTDIANVYVKGLKISNSYGNVNCRGISADSLDARLSSGYLNIETADLNDAVLANSYGDIRLELLGRMQDYSFDLDTSYGQIMVDGKIYDNHAVIDNDTDKNISASLSSGDMRVTFKNSGF